LLSASIAIPPRPREDEAAGGSLLDKDVRLRNALGRLRSREPSAASSMASDREFDRDPTFKLAASADCIGKSPSSSGNCTLELEAAERASDELLELLEEAPLSRPNEDWEKLPFRESPASGLFSPSDLLADETGNTSGAPPADRNETPFGCAAEATAGGEGDGRAGLGRSSLGPVSRRSLPLPPGWPRLKKEAVPEGVCSAGSGDTRIGAGPLFELEDELEEEFDELLGGGRAGAEAELEADCSRDFLESPKSSSMSLDFPGRARACGR